MGQGSSKPAQPKVNYGRRVANNSMECNLLDEDDVVIDVFYINYERDVHNFLNYASHTYILTFYIKNKVKTVVNYKLKKDCFLPDNLVNLSVFREDKNIFIIKQAPIPVPDPALKEATATTSVDDAPPAYQDSSAKP